MKKGSGKWLSWLIVVLGICSLLVCVVVGGGDGLLIIAQLGGIVVGSLSVLMMLYFIRPRRGVHYAYWNKYLLVFGTWLFLWLGGFVLIGYLYVKFDVFSEEALQPLLAFWVFGVGLGILPWFKFVFLPSWGFWRLQGRYPKMVRAARRLKHRGLNYVHPWFMPLILVQGKPYLLAGWGRSPMPPFTVNSPLDTEGRFVTDEAVAGTIMSCYKLAVVVLHSETSLFRAREIERLKGIRRRLPRGFASLRANEAYYREAGGDVYASWQRLVTSETAADALLATRVEKGMWLAGWARDQGLNKLTEIRDEQLHEVERHLADFDRTLAGCTETVAQIEADAAALHGSLTVLADPLTGVDGRRISLQQRKAVTTLLKRLAEFSHEAAWQGPADDFGPSESDWKRWQFGREIAQGRERMDELRRNRARPS